MDFTDILSTYLKKKKKKEEDLRNSRFHSLFCTLLTHYLRFHPIRSGSVSGWSLPENGGIIAFSVNIKETLTTRDVENGYVTVIITKFMEGKKETLMEGLPFQQLLNGKIGLIVILATHDLDNFRAILMHRMFNYLQKTFPMVWIMTLK